MKVKTAFARLVNTGNYENFRVEVEAESIVPEGISKRAFTEAMTDWCRSMVDLSISKELESRKKPDVTFS